MARYFTVAVRDNANSPWGVHFGDYDRGCVEDEAEDQKRLLASRNVKIVSSWDTQVAIEERIAKLNATGK